MMMDAPANETGNGPSPLLVLDHVTKHFGGVTALEGVSFELRAGEIHALLGENGAGKSTLIKVLGGIHRPDSGAIQMDGQAVQIRGVTDADRLGIRIIHQELSLAPNLTIGENIFLGREPARMGFLDRRRIFQESEALVNRLGLHEIRDVHRSVTDLSVAEQQLVEIAHALLWEARVLVLDEPTSSLSKSETEALFATLERLRKQGVGMIYISHRLEEIMRLADRITVLRDGKSVGTQSIDALDKRQLIQWMVGRDVTEHFHRPPSQPGDVVLSVKDLSNRNVHHVSFDLHAGEVLGVAGLVGSGRSKLARAIFGIDPIESGEIQLRNQTLKIAHPSDALKAGIVLVPEDRKMEGLVLSHSVAFNIALPWVRDWITPGWPSSSKRRAIVNRAVRNFGVKVSDPDQPVGSLSGGNQQKVLVGRWMEHRPQVLILDEPTRGVDVGAREELFTMIAEFVQLGMAVLLISSDLAEVLSLSHRVAVYKDGAIHTVAEATTLTPESIMEILTGMKSNEID